MSAPVTILVAAMVAHLVGSAVLLGVISGPEVVWGAPLFALFGIWLMPVEVAVASIQWSLLGQPERTNRDVFVAWLATVPASAMLAALLGPKEEGQFARWAFGYFVGVIAGASLSLLIVARARQTAAKP